MRLTQLTVISLYVNAGLLKHDTIAKQHMITINNVFFHVQMYTDVRGFFIFLSRRKVDFYWQFFMPLGDAALTSYRCA
jgi:hypothetical protein